MEEGDQALLLRYRQGEPQALEVLVQRYRRQLFGFIISMTGGREDADEVFQEVWFRVIRKISSYTDRNFLSWLFRIARNLVIDRSRRRKRWVCFESATDSDPDPADRLEDPGPDPAGNAAAGELGGRIAAAVETLPAEQREVFLMRVQADLAFKEIARLQGVSINTALARMQYALAKLRELLKDDYGELNAFAAAGKRE
jgi:RNA polymerase sigma-70 factor (ECF subfamily)